MGIEPVLAELGDGRNDILDKALGGVDAQVVGALVAPLAVAVHLVVLGTVAVPLVSLHPVGSMDKRFKSNTSICFKYKSNQ